MEKSLEELFQEHDYETITNRFESYLGRYKEIFNPRATTRKVIGIANNSSDIRRSLRYLTHSGSFSEIHQMRTSIIEVFGEEEMSQVIYLSFLETVDKFDSSRGVPFQKFIYNYYPYIFSAEVIKLAGPRQIMNDQKIMSEYISGGNQQLQDSIIEYNLSYIDVGIDWINGETCNEPFTVLTSLERKILVMLYIDKMSQEDVAKTMRYHFSSIKRKRNEIVKKLKKRIEELEEENNG